jgi:hypothetical protein
MDTLNYQHPNRVPLSPQTRSAVSIVAIIAAIVSFYCAAKGHEFIGMFAAILAVGAGLIGGVKALSPRVSGGILSIIAVVLGALGLIVSFIALFV